MKRLFLLNILFSVTISQAMQEKVILRESGEAVKITLDKESFTVSLAKIMPHLTHYKIVPDKETGEETVSGLHLYTSPHKIRNHKGGKIVEINDDLWIYTTDALTGFHSGILIYKGQVMATPKTFFPMGWSETDLYKCIKTRIEQGIPLWKVEDSAPFTIYRISLLADRQPPLILVMRKFANTCILKTVFPECTPPKVVTKLLEELAQEQVQRRAVLRKERLNRVLEASKKHQQKKPIEESILSGLMEEVSKKQANREKVLQFLEAGEPVDCKDSQGRTPLMIVAAAGNGDLIADLLEYGASALERDLRGRTVLEYGLSSLNESVVLSLLTSEVIKSLNNKNSDGLTPLLQVLRSLHEKKQKINYAGLIEIVELLLLYGADPGCTDKSGITALMSSVRLIAPSTEELRTAQMLVALLLSYGADPDVLRVTEGRDGGHTALMYAIEYGYVCLVDELLVVEADYECTDKKGRTALVIARNKKREEITKSMEAHIRQKKQWIDDQGVHELTYACYKNCTRRALKLLASMKCDVNACGYKKDSALYHAVAHNNLVLVRALLASQADPRLQCPAGTTIAAFAQSSTHLDAEIKELITDRFEELNVPAKEAAALKEERKRRALKLFKDQIEQGALTDRTIDFLKSLKPCLIDGESPLAYAIRAKKPKAVMHLSKHKCSYEDEKTELVMLAYNTEDLDVLKAVVKSGCAKEDGLIKLVRLALRTQRSDICHLLKSVQNFYFSLIRLLVQEGDDELLQKLCIHDADLLTPDQAGECVLQAIQTGRQPCAMTLLKYYSQVKNFADRNGMTLLMHAAQQSLVAVFRTLCELGADYELRNKRDQTVESFISLTTAAGQEIGRLHAERQQVLKSTQPRELNTAELANKVKADLIKKGWTPAMAAAYVQDCDELSRFADDDLRATNDEGVTALHIAALHSKSRALHVLLQRVPSDVNRPDKKGRTPLMCAVEKGHEKIIERLLEHNADVMLLDHEKGSAPLYARNHRENVLAILRKAFLAQMRTITKERVVRCNYQLLDLIKHFKLNKQEKLSLYTSLLISEGTVLEAIIENDRRMVQKIHKWGMMILKCTCMRALENEEYSFTSDSEKEPDLLQTFWRAVKNRKLPLPVYIKHGLMAANTLLFSAIAANALELVTFLLTLRGKNVEHFVLPADSELTEACLSAFKRKSQTPAFEWYRHSTLPPLTPLMWAWLLSRDAVIETFIRISNNSYPELTRIFEPAGIPGWLFPFFNSSWRKNDKLYHILVRWQDTQPRNEPLYNKVAFRTCHTDHLNIALSLLNMKLCNTQARDDEGNTFLLRYIKNSIAEGGSKEKDLALKDLCARFVQADVPLHVANKARETVFSWALVHNFPETARWILSSPSFDPTTYVPLESMVRTMNLVDILSLMRMRPDVFKPQELLVAAGCEKRIDLFTILSSSRSDISEEQLFNCLCTFAQKNQHECMDLLLERKSIDINALNKDKTKPRTPLMIAAEAGSLNSMAVLLSRPGINLSVTDLYGDNVRAYARTAETQKLLKEFEMRGLDALDDLLLDKLRERLFYALEEFVESAMRDAPLFFVASTHVRWQIDRFIRVIILPSVTVYKQCLAALKEIPKARYLAALIEIPKAKLANGGLWGINMDMDPLEPVDSIPKLIVCWLFAHYATGSIKNFQLIRLATQLINGGIVPKNYSVACGFLNKVVPDQFDFEGVTALSEDASWAYLLLADRYDKGEGVPQDSEKALKMCERASRGMRYRPSHLAAFYVGDRCLKGLRVPQNLTKATTFFHLVATHESGAPILKLRSAFCLAKTLELSYKDSHDELEKKEALHYYKVCAEQKIDANIAQMAEAELKRLDSPSVQDEKVAPDSH